MARNEFKNSGQTICKNCTKPIVRRQLRLGIDWAHADTGIGPCSPFTQQWAQPTDLEDLNQEDSPIEEVPEPGPTQSLADLRKEPGLSTTEAHNAKITGKSSPRED